MLIRDLVTVKTQPTVVRLDHLGEEGASWITESYYLTEEVETHLQVITHLLESGSGGGVFLIGHFGSGKSHFLAYLTQAVAAGSLSKTRPTVVPISLVNYRAKETLESIILHGLGLQTRHLDRRETFAQLAETHPAGILLILDELSEFLRAKSGKTSFNEDIRFLQFMGEWAQNHLFWILAALQEKIEHTGEMEHDLFRKIKDRYPIRLLLTPTHVKDLISCRILQKQDGYRAATEKLVGQLQTAFPSSPVEFASFLEIYPLHPATLALLEEVRDRFSQARGIVGFTITRLAGDPVLAIKPFLDRAWGSLLTPETIVDHFYDLFKVQSEFLPLAQKLFPYYEKHLDHLFEHEAQRTLANRLIKLLVLFHISPARKGLEVRQAAWFLLYKVSTIDPEKNFTVIGRILDRLVEAGSYVKKNDHGYAIDLREESRETLDHLLLRTLPELTNQQATLLENLIPCLDDSTFNPFQLDRDRTRKHNPRWHFHDRPLQVYFGGGAPVLSDKQISLQIGLPWGPAAEGRNCYRLVPKPLEVSEELRELAALLRLEQGPQPKQLLKAIRERIKPRASLFAAQIKGAYQQAELLDLHGNPLRVLGEAPSKINDWVARFAVTLFRHRYPQFESYAPSHGPLPKEAYHQLLEFAVKYDLCAEDAPEMVKLIREAYLVPMKLLERQGRHYRISPKLDRHELVTLLRPMLDHKPGPKSVYATLSAPIYGLVPDQIHLLLLLLLIQGEIDIFKGRNSLRDLYETLPTPLFYDRIEPGKALTLNQIHDLAILCEGLAIPMAKEANVLGQRRCAQALRKLGQKQRDQLGAFAARLRQLDEAPELSDKIDAHLDIWATLEKGENEIQGVSHFLFQVASPRRFLETWSELSAMPQKLDTLIKETKHCRHLLSHPAMTHCPNGEIQVATAHLAEVPDLSEPDALEEWLSAAREVYRRYITWYREEHDRCWAHLGKLPILAYHPPAIAKSRHLGLEESQQNFDNLRNRIQSHFCRGLSNLDFQPVCLCGFDGKQLPVEEDLARLGALKEALEDGLIAFFGQEKVKQKVREWVDSGMNSGERTFAYLDETKPYPDVVELDLFDKHLAGIELFRQVDPNGVLDLLTERVWERSRLERAFSELIGRWGPRIAFSKPKTEDSEFLLVWSLETALKTGTPLPKGLSSSEQTRLAEMLRPQWVGLPALRALDRLGLGQEAETRILKMVLDGRISKRPPGSDRGPLGAAIAFLDRTRPGHAFELADLANLLYHHHDRLAPLVGQPWRDYLAEVARTPLTEVAPQLLEALDQDSQWLLIDCLGLPLLEMFTTHLAELLPDWRFERVGFARVGNKTDTAAFYQTLADANPHKPFLKINGVDSLVHETRSGFPDLEKLALAELAVSLPKLKGLDPARPLTVFADHGFRLDEAGRSFVHGGTSALERLVPVIEFKPFTSK